MEAIDYCWFGTVQLFISTDTTDWLSSEHMFESKIIWQTKRHVRCIQKCRRQWQQVQEIQFKIWSKYIG